MLQLEKGVESDASRIALSVGNPHLKQAGVQIFHQSPTKETDQSFVALSAMKNPQKIELVERGKISLNKGLEKPLLEKTTKLTLSPLQSDHGRPANIFDRLYSLHEDEMITRALAKQQLAEQEKKQKEAKKRKLQRPETATEREDGEKPRFLELYEMGCKHKADYEEKLRSEEAEERKKHVPAINDTSRLLAASLPPSPAHTMFNMKDLSPEERRAIWEKQRQMQEEGKKDSLTRKYEKELQECTFSPTISPSCFSSDDDATASSPAKTPSSSVLSTPPRSSSASDSQNALSFRSPPQTPSSRNSKNIQLYNLHRVLNAQLEEKREKQRQKELHMPHSPQLLTKDKTDEIVGNVPFEQRNAEWQKKHELRMEYLLEEEKLRMTQEVHPVKAQTRIIPADNADTWRTNTTGVQKHINRITEARKREELKKMPPPSRSLPIPATIPSPFRLGSEREKSQQKQIPALQKPVPTLCTLSRSPYRSPTRG
ncbi:uncharacterized protein MONOS_9457 [Monocercomonoides exilis]|uniref:uncharacterized protein n=1 Tax=Monocercomonoides exilis TaxID=2049356 RepID=UPI00355A15DC|nr:hypothetical protein MONOS_9457 [Monocercomonoides exilis]|eukprot:MONOS_9457.1-p1 / transcript=MONOS_9457.1 / gene=MONOS_9457 / organism=Monocercomonoides_exilis_PA203 / gene_product=unspecified product / transcript_product=unspecified product / location=Mono_scaffold00391:46003-48585(+) / protein_length=485 / sequence_SO=supercontig / SO=protein_coding / is_pseudo=false